MCLFKAKKKCGLYVCTDVPLACEKAYANVVKYDKTMLWHNRLGHMSAKGLSIMKKHTILSDNDVHSELSFCDSCVLGKQHRVSFPTTPALQMLVHAFWSICIWMFGALLLCLLTLDVSISYL